MSWITWLMRMAKKAPTKAEREHMAKVADLGCIVCMNLGHPGTPAEIHHCRTGMGMSQRNDHTKVLPLCFHHHSAQGVDGYHKHPRTWQEAHGTEEQLMKQVGELIA